MFLEQRVSLLFASAIATALLTACGGDNKNFSMPANDSTKVSPTAVASATPTPTAITETPRPAAASLPELAIKALEPYKHSSGILGIDVPKGWKLVDNSQTGELLLTWSEQGERATVSVDIFVPPSEIPSDRLDNTLAVIVKGMYGNQTDFAMKSPVVESTGAVVVEWSATVTVGNEKVNFLANSKLQRRNNKFVIVTFGAIASKFPELKDSFFSIYNSQVINEELAIP
ncbi:hypothetical protein HCU40_11335 [Pseudanabaena biceps]|nr:hypothetical protein [Pseudanabaena biceps]